MGVPLVQIRQLILPNGSAKMGIDDFLVQEGADTLKELIQAVLERRNAFPRHPNTKAYVNRRLQKGRLTRKDAQSIALSVLSELDAGGKRLIAESTNTSYYFDERTHKLMPVIMMHTHGEPLHETPFGQLLYKRFNVSAADNKITPWIASQYTGEQPIDPVEPQRILALPNRPDHIAYQISDSQFALVGPDPKHPMKVLTNGAEGLLFEQGHVDPIDGDELVKEFNKQRKKKVKPWWLEVVKSVNIKEDDDHIKTFAALLYYISPWLNRWRGSQLPVEIIVGEPNSGKSSMCSLRLAILTGRPVLRNMPKDLRDWHTSIGASGGLHVIDNVAFTNKELRQRLSDEMCRITTEPSPSVEMRKLYTTATQQRIPVNVTFALTSIQQPFHNIDLIQRAAVLKMSAVEGALDSDWVGHQMEKFGGRISWLAHHMLVIHKFLNEVVNEGSWDSEYRAAHRLAHYEQNLGVMADVLGINADWLPDLLAEARDRTLSESDWALEGLKKFAEMVRSKSKGKPKAFPASEITNWASMNEEFEENAQLTNVRRLGRYMQSHKQTILRVTGITEVGTSGNRKMYQVIGKPNS